MKGAYNFIGSATRDRYFVFSKLNDNIKIMRLIAPEKEVLRLAQNKFQQGETLIDYQIDIGQFKDMKNEEIIKSLPSLNWEPEIGYID